MGKKKAEAPVDENSVDTEVADQEAAEQETDANEAIRAAFDESVAAELDEDDTKMAMIGGGATFKNVTRLYNTFMIDAGFAISKDDRNAIVADSLEGLDFETEDDFNAAAKVLEEAVKGATDRSAAALVRAYAKKAELPCYVKPKGEGGSRPSFAGDYYNHLASNINITKEEATAYVMGTGDNAATSDNVQKHLSHYLAIWGLVNSIANADVAAAA
jgi:hypothetical protein